MGILYNSWQHLRSDLFDPLPSRVLSTLNIGDPTRIRRFGGRVKIFRIFYSGTVNSHEALGYLRYRRLWYHMHTCLNSNATMKCTLFLLLFFRTIDPITFTFLALRASVRVEQYIRVRHVRK